MSNFQRPANARKSTKRTADAVGTVVVSIRLKTGKNGDGKDNILRTLKVDKQTVSSVADFVEQSLFS